MSYTIHLMGLMYFQHRKDEERCLVLVPDGANPGVGVVSHYASFFIDPNDLVEDDWWRAYQSKHILKLEDDDGVVTEYPMWEFRVPERARIVFCSDEDSADTRGVEDKLPKLSSMDPSLIIDPERADTIAQIPIECGTLSTFKFAGSAAVQWTLKHSGPLVITATIEENGEIMQMVLKPSSGDRGTEIVFSNAYDLLAGDARVHVGQHGQLPGAKDIRSRVAAALTEHHPPSPPSGCSTSECCCEECRCGCQDNKCGCQQRHPHDTGASSGSSASNAPSHRSHFEIYAKLDVERRSSKLNDPVLPKLDPLPFTHKYLQAIDQGEELPGPGCSPTCC